ncbi:hypothetical protein THRCLA_22193 [Thraustotheca clavata]|uniref:Uncharacterized protein n=1 Tax=Thraustotheca clavata TaxID=74557 RepID=A0A1V9ZAG1_9STRA|nr:hypothetical protein THRCLA_22193 [Thraustotheca clavata]
MTDRRWNLHSGNLYTDTSIMAKVTQGSLRPTFSSATSKWFIDFGNRCLSYKPEDCPTSMQASYFIKKQLREMSKVG